MIGGGTDTCCQSSVVGMLCRFGCGRFRGEGVNFGCGDVGICTL